MRARRRFTAAGATALGVALILGAVLAPGAGAQQPAMSIFGATAVARGLDVTASHRPWIFDPVAHAAAPFARGVLNSVPESHSTASALFPGDLASSIVNEGGSIYNASDGRLFYPLTLQANAQDADRQDRQRSIGGGLPSERAGLSAESGSLRAIAKPDTTRAAATLERVVFQPPGEKAPLVSVDSVESVTDARKEAALIRQVARARATGVELLRGMIRIESIVATAVAASNGVEMVENSGRVRLAGVEVLDSQGKPHRAYIDDQGIHVDDPSLPEGANQTLSTVLQYMLARAGITIRLLDVTAVGEEAAGTAFAGGLLLDIRTGPCEICPSLLRALPPELSRVTGPVYERATICIPRVPVCLSPALIPFPPNESATITIASAAVSASGALEAPLEEFGGGDSGGADVDGGDFFSPGGELGGGTDVLGEQFGGGQAGGTVEGPSGTGSATGIGGARLFGLVAEMPDGVLAVIGSALLLFAMGLLVAPSFRPR